jgi:TonB-dependent receptor
VFPDLNIKWKLDDNTNIRGAITRGIARANYSSLAPTLNAVQAVRGTLGQGISLGNPGLKPQYSWNYDLLAEHYFPSVGVISGGFFAKDLTNIIFSRSFIYTGKIPSIAPGPGGCPSDCYYATQDQNGPGAHEWGIEADYMQHLTFLPGALQGIGFDVNWTHVESNAVVPVDTTTNYQWSATGGNDTVTVHPYTKAFRHAPIPRQFPNLVNVALLYDYSIVSVRLAGNYNSASVYSYGADGSDNPGSGDNWNYPHWQIDGSASVNVWRSTTLSVQALNLNNETFGFFNGQPAPSKRFNVQREYTGTTWWFGLRQGF